MRRSATLKHLTNFSTHLRHGGCSLICPNHDTTQVQLAVKKKKNTDWKKARPTLLVWITATLHFPFGWFSKRRRKKMAIGWSWSEKGYNGPIKLQQTTREQQQQNSPPPFLAVIWKSALPKSFHRQWEKPSAVLAAANGTTNGEASPVQQHKSQQKEATGKRVWLSSKCSSHELCTVWCDQASDGNVEPDPFQQPPPQTL